MSLLYVVHYVNVILKLFCMKKYSLLLICIFVSLVAMSQKAVITFQSKNHDFGTVNEEDGNITTIFEFKNEGASPLVINRVQASCGCTTPIYTKAPIEPGKTGSVSVTYNPAGRPGPFTKTITVYSNALEEQVVLVIKGEVATKPKSPNEEYPVNMGGLLLKTKVLQLNNVEKGKTQTKTLEIFNSTKATIKPIIENLPPYLTVSISPVTLKPNDAGQITFTFNSNKCTKWGPINEALYLSLNGQKKLTNEFKFSVITNIVENFSGMTLDQKRNAPILELDKKAIELGTVRSGDKRLAKFKLTNKGQNPLEIRRVISSNNEIIPHQSKLTINRGKSSELLLDLVTQNMPVGDYRKSITLQTNDPDNSFMILILAWRVVK